MVKCGQLHLEKQQRCQSDMSLWTLEIKKKFSSFSCILFTDVVPLVHIIKFTKLRAEQSRLNRSVKKKRENESQTSLELDAMTKGYCKNDLRPKYLISLFEKC
jgi:hypothetical protein